MSIQINISLKTTLRTQIIAHAKSLGFDLVGFTPAKINSKYKKVFENWLKNDRHGDMAYMGKIEQRFDLQKVLPNAKTVIVLGTNYYREHRPLKRGHGRIARYAYGRDYHKVIGKRLKKLEEFIAELVQKVPSFSGVTRATSQTQINLNSPSANSKSHQRSNPILTRSYVDTGPLMERTLAEQAGIGRIGKNGCVISKEFGSWIFLSEIISVLDLNFSQEIAQPQGLQIVSPHAEKDRWSNPHEKIFNVCGNCTRCITACPTDAIIAPGIIDSKLCISYLTIENKDKIPPKLAKILKKTKRLFGCDICQEVCPHNRARQKSACAFTRLRPSHPRLSSRQVEAKRATASHSIPTDWPKIAGDQLELKKIKSIKTPEEFTKIFAGSPLMRAKKEGMTRNAEVLIEAKCD